MSTAVFMQLGSTWLNADCTQRLTCNGAQGLTVEDVTCNDLCTVRDGRRACACQMNEGDDCEGRLRLDHSITYAGPVLPMRALQGQYYPPMQGQYSIRPRQGF